MRGEAAPVPMPEPNAGYIVGKDRGFGAFCTNYGKGSPLQRVIQSTKEL